MANVALGMGAGGELVGERERGLLNEGGLGFEVARERVGHDSRYFSSGSYRKYRSVFGL